MAWNRLKYIAGLLLSLVVCIVYADQCPPPSVVSTWVAMHQAQGEWILHNINGVKVVAAFDHVEWNAHGGGNVPPNVVACAYTSAPGQLPWVFVMKAYDSNTPPNGVNWSPIASYYGCVATNALDSSTCSWT